MLNINIQTEHVFFVIVVIVFIYLLYQQFLFQKGMFFFSKTEGFTPKEVKNIIQQPNSNEIGTLDLNYVKNIGIKTVSNGYNENTINNLKPSKPQPFSKYSNEEIMGNFSTTKKPVDDLPTEEFEYPNKYNFTVKYDCRRTATGMFSDCGVYSANTAWTADPYKGLNCPLQNTKTPNIVNNHQRTREVQYT